MSSATDEMRAMLDERGVEWRKPSPEYWMLLGMPEGDSSTIVGELSIEEAIDGTLVIWNATPEQAIAATLGATDAKPTQAESSGTCHPISCNCTNDYTNGERTETCSEVYLLMATDIGDGREEVLGVYATEEAATAAINENQFGHALHHVRKWEVDA